MTQALTDQRRLFAAWTELRSDFHTAVFGFFAIRSALRSARLFWLFTAILGSMASQAGQMHALSGHLPPVPAMMQPLGRLPGTNLLHLAICRPLRNREALTNLLRQLYNPSSPTFHHFLTPQQFTAAFDPTESDYQAVIDFAKTSGLTITGTCSNRALLEVRGRVSDADSNIVSSTIHPRGAVFRFPLPRF
jgi:subtilase family serine protease